MHQFIVHAQDQGGQARVQAGEFLDQFQTRQTRQRYIGDDNVGTLLLENFKRMFR